MAFNSNGQIQFLVLDSLSNGSKYGLEIIEYISHKTDGNYIMKKPTLYSCLTRMEKKGLVSSSYWGDSEFGGKRHYYTITNLGRKSLEELAPDFEDAQFQNEQKLPESTTTVSNDSEKDDANSIDGQNAKPIFLQQKNIFDLVKNEQNEAPEPEHVEELPEGVVENQIDIFSYQPPREEFADSETDEETVETEESIENDINNEEQEKIEYYQSILEQDSSSIKDDARFLEDDETKQTLTPYQEEQNKKLYDTSNELKRYRKKKSFAENQIEMSVVYENADDADIQRNRIEQLKQSMLNLKQNSQENFIKSQEDKQLDNSELFYKKETIDENNLENLEDETIKDDAIFITNPVINDGEIPIQKKITPPNIEVNIYDDNLPAPKRNSNLEPTYKDMMAKLFERKKEKVQNVYEQKEEISTPYSNVESFADYGILKKYYESHGIVFKEYKKTNVDRKHNTNLLNFISSTILLLLSSVCSAVLFGILSGLQLLKTPTNFMFYTVPILFLLYGIYTFIRYKLYPSKKANLVYNSLINWAVFILGSLVIFVINIACGMQYETMSQYLTSLLIPIFAILIAFPVNYYIKKFLYKKYSK